MSCLFGHKWDGCKCEKCGKINNQKHSWHKYGSCYEICEVCRTANTSHKFTKKHGDLICDKCGIHGFNFSSNDHKEYFALIKIAIIKLGEEIFNLQYVHRSLVEKLNSNNDIVLDSHEVAGLHLLLKTAYLFYSNAASPTAGGLMFGEIPTANSLNEMDAAFKLRDNVKLRIAVLQRRIGESSENDIDMSSKRIKEKLGMYLEK